MSANASLPLTLTPEVGEPVPFPTLKVKLPSTLFLTAISISWIEALAGIEQTTVSHPDSAAVGQYRKISSVTDNSVLSTALGAKSPETSSSSLLLP